MLQGIQPLSLMIASSSYLFTYAFNYFEIVNRIQNRFFIILISWGLSGICYSNTGFNVVQTKFEIFIFPFSVLFIFRLKKSNLYKTVRINWAYVLFLIWNWEMRMTEKLILKYCATHKIYLKICINTFVFNKLSHNISN